MTRAGSYTYTAAPNWIVLRRPKRSATYATMNMPKKLTKVSGLEDSDICNYIPTQHYAIVRMILEANVEIQHNVPKILVINPCRLGSRYRGPITCSKSGAGSTPAITPKSYPKMILPRPNILLVLLSMKVQ